LLRPMTFVRLLGPADRSTVVRPVNGLADRDAATDAYGKVMP
jgi:hypothetical protein